ncbi:unnamed protein product [Staurois parvus]|uniref:Uncharacterized protein n=1 Tax=Staurois parvus TaxID=386267 RepID=A0ABN9FRB4_9NEOB|nr:unnamed protein product [Staurois parvus]
MSPLQHSRPSPLADAGIRVLVPESVGTYGTYGGKFKHFKIKHYCFKNISHTFCPYCFVLCPACIFTVLSAWKLRKVHGVQKASL